MRTLVIVLVGLVLVVGATADDAEKKSLKQYAYQVKPARVDMLTNGLTKDEEAIVDEHFNYLKDLTERRVVILAGRTQNNDNTSFGIVIFRAESEDAARAIMRGDPAVKKGIMRATLFPFRVALMADR